MSRPATLCMLMLMVKATAFAQIPAQRFSEMKAQADAQGWTFRVGENDATRLPKSALCGLRVPPGWQTNARFRTFAAKSDLPATFDWRENGGCPPVRNQWGCGSCWAFGTAGVLECSILLKDGAAVDLSEQWLVSCNQETDPPETLAKGAWGCAGGWWAYDYYTGLRTDPCGGSGAVLESHFPYTAADSACACPYEHVYAIDDWAFIGPEEGVADTNAIKQAIMAYGPVGVAVYVGDLFMGYNGGIYGFSENLEVNHAVVLVGWDDTQGTNGVWILRNSWGPNWGESGYMRIEYGCSNIGYGACYVEYAGMGHGRGPAIIRQPESLQLPVGWHGTLSVGATGIAPIHYHWKHNGRPVGADTPTYHLASVRDADTGSYVCDVEDIRGTTTSNTATLEIDPVANVPLRGSACIILLAALCMMARKRLPT